MVAMYSVIAGRHTILSTSCGNFSMRVLPLGSPKIIPQGDPAFGAPRRASPAIAKSLLDGCATNLCADQSGEIS